MSEIKPALTPDEWREGAHFGHDVTVQRAHVGILGNPRLHVNVVWHPVTVAEDLHALAALALHGQPFGFTHEGLSILARMVYCSDHNCGDWECFTATEQETARRELAKIAALLPPEGR